MSTKLAQFHEGFVVWMDEVETYTRTASPDQLAELLSATTAASPHDSFSMQHCKRVIAEWVKFELALRERRARKAK